MPGLYHQRGRYYVYILSNEDRSRISINAAYDLPDRIRRLRDYYPLASHFPSVPRCLVLWEVYRSAIQAVEKCRELRRLTRFQLERLVTLRNPEWDDLFAAVELLDRVDHFEEISVED